MSTWWIHCTVTSNWPINRLRRAARFDPIHLFFWIKKLAVSVQKYVTRSDIEIERSGEFGNKLSQLSTLWEVQNDPNSRFWTNAHRSGFMTQLALTVPTTLRSQIGTVVYVRSHNFFVSEPIATILGVLERRDPVLSNALKIIEIGWETTKLWPQTHATVQNVMISVPDKIREILTHF